MLNFDSMLSSVMHVMVGPLDRNNCDYLLHTEYILFIFLVIYRLMKLQQCSAKAIRCRLFSQNFPVSYCCFLCTRLSLLCCVQHLSKLYCRIVWIVFVFIVVLPLYCTAVFILQLPFTTTFVVTFMQMHTDTFAYKQ